jgi:6-phosphogluconolactonase
MPSTKIYPDPAALAAAFAADFAAWVESQPDTKLTIALSGGSTPKRLFELWAHQYASTIDWSRLHFFWGDERCVAPDNPESNYGVAKALLFDHITIATTNIHRVRGEAAPKEEAARYEQEIAEYVKTTDGAPQFDLIILGMGDDGHTASIFPHQSEFLKSPRVCEVATHPQSGQQRITLTGPVINSAKKIDFLVTGASKSEVLADVIGQTGAFESYPAAAITGDKVCFYLDQSAAAKLNSST